MAGKYALIIGNSEYDDPGLAKLKTPDADVHGLAEILREQEIGDFSEVIELTNEDEPVIRRAISTFFKRRKTDDLVLLYFSGHGVLDDRGRLFLAVRDTQKELLQATSISSAFITEDMDACKSKRQVLILDCCNSGAFARGAKGVTRAVTEATFEGKGYGRVVLTASDATQYAFEGNRIIQRSDLSLFTHFLLQGLATGEADIDKNGVVTLDELYEYTYNHVIDQTPNQTPSKWAYRQQGEIVIAFRPMVPYELKLSNTPAKDSEVKAGNWYSRTTKPPQTGKHITSRKSTTPTTSYSSSGSTALQSILDRQAAAHGIDLRLATSQQQRIAVYQRSLEALRRLPDEVDLRYLTQEVISVIEADLRRIISGIDDIYHDSFTSHEGLLANLRLARVELCVASDMLERNKFHSFPNIIVKFQRYVSDSLQYF